MKESLAVAERGVFFFLCTTFQVDTGSDVIFFPDTAPRLGDISVSTQIWIYLTHSTLAWSRPPVWCIFRAHFLQHKWCVCVDKTGYCLTLSEPCSPHRWVPLVSLHFSFWDSSHVEGALCSFWRRDFFNIYNIIEVMLWTNYFSITEWTQAVLRGKTLFPEHCLKLVVWQGPPHTNKVKQYQFVYLVPSVTKPR